ncbi:hypothetical protein SAMN05216228_105526, partial [Rhizobium tibeticum]
MICVAAFWLRHAMACRRDQRRPDLESAFQRPSPGFASARAGRLTPAKQGRRGGSRLDAHEDFIIGMIEEEKDITLNEMV